MRVKSKSIKFEWDEWNLDKSYLKHGVLPKEAEEIFVDGESIVLPGVQHSQNEERFIIAGKTLEETKMFVVFTFRNDKIRVISARRMHGKEVKKYERINNKTKVSKKNTKI